MRRTDLLKAVLLLAMVAASPGGVGAEDVWPAMPHDAGARTEGRRGRKYAPDRPVDVLHVRIDVTPDFDHGTVEGVTTLRFAPIARAVDRLVLDAVDLTVSQVTGQPGVKDFTVGPQTLDLTFVRAIAPGEEATVTIAYRAEPRRGLYFRTPKQGYPDGEEQLWTQGETHEARHWFPTVDYPNERFTSEVICRVPEGMMARSNGRLAGQEKDRGGRVAWRWTQDQPHPGYLIALVAGYFEGIEDAYRGIPIAFWASPSAAPLIGHELDETRRMLAFFEQEIGVPYPWAKYEQAAVKGFLYSGMENTSLTILTDEALYPAGVGRVRENGGLIAHELAHQWFGDYVTCKDWSHAWLNEGFASYYAALYREASEGTDVMRYRLWDAAGGLLAMTDDTRPIVDRDYEEGFDQFTFRAYTKGAWVLHMLREELGGEVFREGVRRYLERHALGSVVTEDLNRAMEEVSGRSLDRFFDQWVAHGGVPELDVTYEWNGAARQARVSVKQTQKLGEQVLLFDVPLTIRFTASGWTRDETVRVREEDQDFTFTLDRAPATVRIDPEAALLARIKFEPGRTMLLAQLNDPADALGRARAARALGEAGDLETVRALANVLGGDPFYGARLEAIGSLRRIGTGEAVHALIGAGHQPDDRVRLARVEALASMFRSEAKAPLLELADTEANPLILAEAISGLGKYPDEDLDGRFGAWLAVDSFEHAVARAAMQALRMRDAAEMAEPVRARIAAIDDDLPGHALAEALETAGFLSRRDASKTAARDFLLGYLSRPGEDARVGALRGLGELAELSSLAAIEACTGEDQPERVRKAARDAAERVRSGRESDVAVRDLRRELLELKDATAQLEKDVEALEEELSQPGTARGAPAKPGRRFLGLF